MTEREPKCLFCGKPKSSGKRFIGGGGAIICEDCIRSSNDILTRLKQADEERTLSSFIKDKDMKKPREIVKFLDQYVVGQDRAKNQSPWPFTTTTSESTVWLIRMSNFRRAIF